MSNISLINRGNCKSRISPPKSTPTGASKGRLAGGL